VRTVGVEEEMLLVDIHSGRTLSVAGQVVGRPADLATTGAGAGGTVHARNEGAGEVAGAVEEQAQPGGRMEGELQLQQIEVDTQPCASMTDLEAEVRRWRGRAAAAARSAGARVAAIGTSPLPVRPTTAASPRYQRMIELYGLTTREQLTCGCHIHVSVASDEEGVGVLDRIRVWLPTLLALSSNSPFWDGKDTRYASYRSQAWLRWPSAGPTEVFGSVAAYRQLVDAMLASGVLLDEGMVYFDARLSSRYPTVELRAPDVCLDPRDTVLLAALGRALVETAAGEWGAGQPSPAVPAWMLRLASWQAGRRGIETDLLDPLTARPRPAGEVVAALLEHVRPALRSTGDEDLVEERLADLLRRGTGAQRQRRVLEHTGSLVDVVADATRVTAGLD
jgi:carboxylate-amine ligase